MADFSRKITYDTREVCKKVHMLSDLWERVWAGAVSLLAETGPS